MKKRKPKINYIPYMDSMGNTLSEDEILFTKEEYLGGKQKLEIWDMPESEKEEKVYTVNSDDVELIFEEEIGNFPTALITATGEKMYLKISAKSGEVLPMHAGAIPSLDGIFAGPPSAGKTTSILQICDEAFFDMVARETDCCLWDDIPVQSEARKRYEQKREDFKNHILPPPTMRNEEISPYVFHISYMQGNMKKHILLKLQDFDGQDCVSVDWDSKLLPYKFFLLTIGADELIAGEHGQVVQYSKVVDQMIPKLKVMRNDPDYEIVVIISKCDLLDRDNPYLKNAFHNSIEMDNGKMIQKIHGKGFDYQQFNQRSGCIKAYLKNECPNFYNKLANSIPEHNLSFCMIANVGEECKDNKYVNYRPFCIDEPILLILASRNMYPIAVADKRIITESVGGNKSKNDEKPGLCRRWIEWIKEKIIGDDFDEFDDEQYDVKAEKGGC